MAVIDVGVRELQRDTSRLVRNVEEAGTTYRVTMQGRPTSVVLSRLVDRRSGASADEIRRSALYRGKSAELIAAQLAAVEDARTRAGSVGRES